MRWITWWMSAIRDTFNDLTDLIYLSDFYGGKKIIRVESEQSKAFRGLLRAKKNLQPKMRVRFHLWFPRKSGATIQAEKMLKTTQFYNYASAPKLLLKQPNKEEEEKKTVRWVARIEADYQKKRVLLGDFWFIHSLCENVKNCGGQPRGCLEGNEQMDSAQKNDDDDEAEERRSTCFVRSRSPLVSIVAYRRRSGLGARGRRRKRALRVLRLSENFKFRRP